MSDTDPVLNALQKCQSRLQARKADGDAAEDAVSAFAELGQQVDAVLEERRIAPEDRRKFVRTTPDRRQTS